MRPDLASGAIGWRSGRARFWTLLRPDPDATRVRRTPATVRLDARSSFWTQNSSLLDAEPSTLESKQLALDSKARALDSNQNALDSKQSGSDSKASCSASGWNGSDSKELASGSERKWFASKRSVSRPFGLRSRPAGLLPLG